MLTLASDPGRQSLNFAVSSPMRLRRPSEARDSGSGSVHVLQEHGNPQLC